MLTHLIAAALLTVPLPQETDTVVSVAPGARLDVHALGGEVVVRTWDRSEMRVVARHGSRDRVEISTSAAVARVRVKAYRGVPSAVDLEITIPRGMDVDLGGTFLYIDIEGVTGEVTAETVHGDVVLRGGRGVIQLQSTQGSMDCVDAEGRISVGTLNGSLRLRNVAGEVTAETVNGSITAERVDASTVDFITVNGRITYEGTVQDGGRYGVSTHNGDISFAVPQSTNATMSVSSFSGEFVADFPVTLTETSAGGKRFSFVLGNGSARVELESFGGTIRLRRP
jgi:DUF4097 and DUF4098 domain-containing protein YvlB